MGIDIIEDFCWCALFQDVEESPTYEELLKALDGYDDLKYVQLLIYNPNIKRGGYVRDFSDESVVDEINRVIKCL